MAGDTEIEVRINADPYAVRISGAVTSIDMGPIAMDRIGFATSFELTFKGGDQDFVVKGKISSIMSRYEFSDPLMAMG